MQAQSRFFSEKEEQKIITAIAEAEKQTSGEIRVHIESRAGKNPIKLARKAFINLGMRDTELHNGVLFFLGLEDRKFVILGDDGINEKVPDGFWDTTRDVVLANFRKNLFVQGLIEGIQLAGEQLATYFSFQKDDVNELPNAISYGTKLGDN